MFDRFNIAHGGPQSPCAPNCVSRNAECHAHCVYYRQYEKEREAYREKRNQLLLGKVHSKSMKRYIDKQALEKNR